MCYSFDLHIILFAEVLTNLIHHWWWPIGLCIFLHA